MSKSAALNLARTTPAEERDMAPQHAPTPLPIYRPCSTCRRAKHSTACSRSTKFSTPNCRRANLSLYEAGGGSISFLPSDVLRRAHVTVVDIDEEQLRNNGYAHKTILGDIQTYRFKPGSFDLVICYNVIEHLPDVEAALTRLL